MENNDVLIAEINKGIEKVKADMLSKTEFKALQEDFDKLKGLKDLSDKQAETIKGLEASFVGLSEKLKSYENEKDDDKFAEKLKAAADTLKIKRDGKVSVGEYRSKTVGNMSMANTTGRVVPTMVLPGVNMVPRNVFVIRALSNVGTTVSNLVEWVEQSGIEGGAEMTGEGLKKSQFDFNLVAASAGVKKITSFVKVTTEMLDDVPLMESMINGELQYQLSKKEEEQLLTGTGLTVYLNGITKYAQSLDLAALQNTFDLNKSNRWDAIGAAITQIEENLGGVANVIFMRKSDLFLMVNGSRTTTGEYNYPVTVTPDGTFIMGVRVVTSNTIPAGYFLVADMTKFNINDRTGLSIELGYEGDDFVKNFVTIRGEYRLVSYVKANDVEGFVYDSFANAKTFLERNT